MCLFEAQTSWVLQPREAGTMIEIRERKARLDEQHTVLPILMVYAFVSPPTIAAS